MTLKEHIDDIRESLEKGELPPNEAAVCDDIVRRVVHELGWPRFQSRIVYPQYPVEGGKVDFALCHPPSEPCVFIEVKQVGGIEEADAEEQLFRYAFRRGVPIAILTDGREWHFFYPIGQGDYKERKVHEMDITEGDSEENAERLNRYLNYASIQTGEVTENIKKDYEEVVQQRQVETRLPEVWNELVQQKNEDLLLVMMDAAKNKIGHEPTEGQVLDFLKSLEKKAESNLEAATSAPISSTQLGQHRGHRKQKKPQTRLRVTMPNGERIEHHNATETFAEVLLKLIEMLGAEDVIRADEERLCISTSSFDMGRSFQQYDRYYISKDYGTSRKKQLLERMASRLSIQLQVEIVDKQREFDTKN